MTQSLPSDYEECGECGFNHDYEYEQAYAHHSKVPMTQTVVQKLVAAVIAYVHPIKIKDMAGLDDSCPRHGDDCPTGRAHCKECSVRLHEGFCINRMCAKSYEGKQTTRL